MSVDGLRLNDKTWLALRQDFYLLFQQSIENVDDFSVSQFEDLYYDVKFAYDYVKDEDIKGGFVYDEEG